ncbi:MAG: hypothetical protein C1O27_002434, partial [Chloroflexi bacterium]
MVKSGLALTWAGLGLWAALIWAGLGFRGWAALF